MFQYSHFIKPNCSQLVNAYYIIEEEDEEEKLSLSIKQNIWGRFLTLSNLLRRVLNKSKI
jgi:hypothetical protein